MLDDEYREAARTPRPTRIGPPSRLPPRVSPVPVYLLTRAVGAFGLPSEEERQRPRFWRFWRALPPDGLIGVHFGGWALNAVSKRVQQEIDDDEFDLHLGHARRE